MRFLLRYNIALFKIKKIAIMSLISLFCNGIAYAKDKEIDLTFSHFLGPDSFFQVDLIEPWVSKIEEDSGGRVRIKIVNNTSPLGHVKEQAANVAEGKVDIALGIRGAEAARFPGTSVAEVPMAVRDATSGSRALWRLYKQGLIAQEYAGFKVLAIFVQNPGLIHTVEKLVQTPEDMRGLRMRAPNQATATVLAAIGAHPTILQVDDVMPNLDAGNLDGVITNWGNPLPNFDTKVRHHTNVRFYAAAFFIVMNKQRYDALPYAVKRIIDRHSGLRWVEDIGGQWNKWDEVVRARSIGLGQTIFTPDEVQMAKWNKAFDPAVNAYLAELTREFPQADEAYRTFLRYQGGVVQAP